MLYIDEGNPDLKLATHSAAQACRSALREYFRNRQRPSMLMWKTTDLSNTSGTLDMPSLRRWLGVSATIAALACRDSPHRTRTMTELHDSARASIKETVDTARTRGVAHGLGFADGRAPDLQPACAPYGGDTTRRVYFDFQVDRGARGIGRRPTPHRSDEGGLVQFIVDTAGVPESGSLRVVKRPTIGVVDTAAAWRRLRARRFAPAVYRGCRVRAVVQEKAPALADRDA